MSRSRFIVLTAALCLLVGLSAFAQTSSSLQGTVTTDGTALPGATVTIASPQMQGTRTTVTDNNGGYVFASVPPGKYTVKFEMDGMATVSKAASLSLNVTNRVDAAMQLSAMAEAITVTASAPAVLETSQVSTNLDGALMDELPINRNPLAAASLAPGVTSNTASASQLSISGSPGYDNLVMVNGVAITENVRSQALNLYIEDAIQETTILSGAVSAEWGRFTGGVVNSITRSGGNEFSGSFRDSLSNPQWQNERPGETISIDTINEVYEATLGGYILRDRLWFFLAGRSAETAGSAQTRLTNIEFPTGFQDDRYEYKLTAQITPKHSVVGSYLDYETTSANSRFTTAHYDLFSLTDRVDPMTLLGAHYNGILTSNLLVEAHYSERTWDVATGSGSTFTDLVKGTLMLNRGDANARFNSPTFCGVCDTETRNNEGLTLKANYYISTSNLGTHNLVGGYENYAEHRHANNYQSGSNFRIFFTNVIRVGAAGSAPLLSSDGQVHPQTGTNTFIRWTPIFNESNTENDLQTDSLFLNDRWDLSNKWSFNVGVRYDKNDAVDANGNVASDDQAFSPRLTAIYDLKGDGRHRFTASYNRYVSRIVEGTGTSAEASGSPATIDYRYGGPAINPAGTPVGSLLTANQAAQVMFDWFNANGGTDNDDLLLPGGAFNIPGAGTIFPDTIDSPNVDEYVIGYGSQFSSNSYFKVDYIRREWSDFYAFRIDQSTPTGVTPSGRSFDVRAIENSNDITREYDGFQFQAAWRPSRFNVGLNYTYSELRGNDTQESSVSGTVGNNPEAIYYPEFTNYANANPVGWQAGDQRHVARAWVGYDVPTPTWFGAINLSILQNYGSGLPYSAAGLVDVRTYAGAPSPTALGYLNAPNEWTYYFSERGAFRTDDVTSTDFSVNYTRQLFRNLQIFAQGEMFNVFDERAVTAVNTSVFTSRSGATNCPGCVAFNPFTDTPVEGTHWRKGPNFGKPTGATFYQSAVLYRFSLGLRF